MPHYFAVVTNYESNRQFEVGAWSEEELNSTLEEIQRTGYEDLSKCSILFYTA